MKKKKSICLTAVVTAVLISGCVMNTGARVYDSDRAIASSSNSYNLIDYTGNQNGNTVSGSAEKLDGMDTIWSYEAEEEKEVTLSWKLNVSSGKAKFVLINPDGELTTLVECFAGEDSEQSSSGTFEIKQGENRVKLVGAENTSLEYEFTADEGEVSSFG